MPQSSSKLRFIQILPNVSSTGEFILKDLPGSGKRIDVLCRCLSACFDWAPETWPKQNLEFVAVIEENTILVIDNPEESSKGEAWWASMIKNALQGNSTEFITVQQKTLDALLEEYQEDPNSKIWVLDETGIPLREAIEFDKNGQNSFMLGDHRGFDSKTMEVIEKFKIDSLSIGELSHLSSHTVATVITSFECG
ncbi:MAG: hypothetical protein ACTSU3_11075 [Candidatus Thorarchaeota archaeon]